MHTIKKVLFGLIIFTVVGTKSNIVFASNNVSIDHILTNEALIQGQETPISFIYSTHDIEKSDLLSAVDHAEVPSYWLIPASDYGYVYHSYVVVYENGDTLRGYDSNLNIELLDKYEDIKEIKMYYSHASKITVNRYLNEVDDKNLLESVDYYGHDDIDYMTYEGDEIFVSKQSLTPNKEYLDYQFVSADVDITQATFFELENAKVINMIYTEAEVISPKDIVIRCIDKKGNILEEKVISGELGDTVLINDSFFKLKDLYQLAEKPEIDETQVSEEEQEFVFVYEQEANKEKPITEEIVKEDVEKEEDIPKEIIDENNNKKKNDPIEKENLTESLNEDPVKVVVETPPTKVANNSIVYFIVILIGLSSLLFIRKANKA